ncbi:MAG: peptide ABC transporter substrate-binding protein [Pyrinomonadaceae bacterium]
MRLAKYTRDRAAQVRFARTMLLMLLALQAVSCAHTSARAPYFGRVEPPPGQVLRYISGSEPESLDPQISTGQPEARIYMSMFEGLVEYDPKTMEPIPAIAEKWEANEDSSVFVFHLRRDARWSDGNPITAQDFVYSIRRGLAPATASRSASFAYYIKSAQGYNSGGQFVRDAATGKFLTEKDVAPVENPAATTAAGNTSSEGGKASSQPAPESPRLVVAGSEKGREKQFKANPKLRAAVEGKEFVPVKAEDVGVEAVDDYTLRITLTQSAPFFISVLPHQFFRAVPRKAIERWGDTAWTQPEHIITSGPFKLQTWKPYNEIVVVKDPMYWDAAHVRLEEIRFYPSDDNTTTMNLYKAGEVDAVPNHSVPAAWLDGIRPLKDYMDAPEAGIEYYLINVTKPPMNDVRVRKAFNMAIDKRAAADWKRIVKPLTAFSPEGIFKDYPQPKGDEFNPERAKKLLVEAGYKDASGKFDPSKFPVGDVELSYNAHDSVRIVAEFMQAQWKRNLGLTIPLKAMETKAYLAYRANLEYKGIARGGYSGDYMDPFTFLSLFYTAGNDNGTGWYDPKYAAMLDEANRTLDARKRYELLAKAEAFMLDAQPVIPLWTPATNWLKKPYVKGMYANPGTLHAWKFVYIEYDPAKWNGD